MKSTDKSADKPTGFRRANNNQRSAEAFIQGAQVGTVATDEPIHQEDLKPDDEKPKRTRKRKKRDIFVSHTIPLTEEEYQRLERVSAKLGQLHNGTIRYALIQLEKMLED